MSGGGLGRPGLPAWLGGWSAGPGLGAGFRGTASAASGRGVDGAGGVAAGAWAAGGGTGRRSGPRHRVGVVVVMPVVAVGRAGEQVVGLIGPLLDAVGLGLRLLRRFLGLAGSLASQVGGLAERIGPVLDSLLLFFAGPFFSHAGGFLGQFGSFLRNAGCFFGLVGLLARLFGGQAESLVEATGLG